MGTIEKTDASGNLQLRLDSGRRLAFNIKQNPHLDYGYAVTSHSSQGQTADRVLVHVDTEEGQQLVNARMAYVAVSRGRYDAQIYTNDKEEMAEALGREHSHSTALGSLHRTEQQEQREATAILHEEHGLGPDIGSERTGRGDGHNAGNASQGANQGEALGESHGHDASEGMGEGFGE